jgi:hypothetical protein
LHKASCIGGEADRNRTFIFCSRRWYGMTKPGLWLPTRCAGVMLDWIVEVASTVRVALMERVAVMLL